MISRVKRYFLEIIDFSNPIELNIPENYQIILDDKKNFELNKFFYKQIGKKYQWVDRLVWSDATWQKYTANKNLKTYVLKENNNLIGYFELIYNNEAFDCEIAYFGILEEFFSKGYGGYLLSEAIKLGFQSDVKSCLLYTSPSPRD